MIPTRQAPGTGRTVRDVMRSELVTVVPEMTVRELILTLLENAVSGAPVLDSRAKIVGVVSATDVLRLISRDAEIPAGQLAWEPRVEPDEGDDDGAMAALTAAETAVPFTAPDTDALAATVLDQCQVRDIMTPVAFSVKPSDGLAETSRFLLQGRIHRALVVENGVLLGIVTPFDLLQSAGWD